MGDLQRKINISADASGLSDEVRRASKDIENSFKGVGDSIDRATRTADKATEQMASKFSQLDRDTSSLFKGLLQDSEKYGKSVTDRVRFMEREVKLMERMTREERLRAKEAAQMKASQQIESGVDPKIAKGDLSKANAKIQQDARIDAIQQASLRNKIDAYKDTGRQAIVPPVVGTTGGGERGGGVGFGRGARNIAGGVTKGTGWGGLAAAGFTGLASLMLAKTLQEGMRLDESQGLLSGFFANSTDARSQFDESILDKDLATVMGLGRGIGRARGTTSGLGKAVKGQIQLERAFGLDEGSLGSMERTLRADKGGDAQNATLEMLGIMKKSRLYGIGKDDFTMLGELMERNNELNQVQASQAEKVDATTSTQLMKSFGSIGGSFKDFRQTSTIQTINKSITDPNNDFSRAFVLRSIREANPDASLVDILKIQEQGVFGAGTMPAIMRGLTSKFQGDALSLSTSRLFGLKTSQGEALANAFQRNPTMFNNVTSKAQMMSMVDVANRADANTGDVQRFNAKLRTGLGMAGKGAIDKISGLVDVMSGDGSNIDTRTSQQRAIDAKVNAGLISRDEATKQSFALEAQKFGVSDQTNQNIPRSFEMQQMMEAENFRAKVSDFASDDDVDARELGALIEASRDEVDDSTLKVLNDILDELKKGQKMSVDQVTNKVYGTE